MDKIKTEAAAALLTMALMACFTACPPMYPDQPAEGLAVEIKVVPPDAAVIIDRRLYGNVWDIDKVELRPGLHTVEIRKKGYMPYQKEFRVENAPMPLEVELKKIE